MPRAAIRRSPAVFKVAGRLAGSRDQSSAFEDLVSRLSAAFSGVAADAIDREIERWLKRIVLALGLDRCALVQIDPGDGTICLTHRWAREGVGPMPKSRKFEELLPWGAAEIRAGRTVAFSRVSELPAEASRDAGFIRACGTKSSVSIPLKVAGAVVGALTFASSGRERSWPPRLLQRLNLVAEIFANALERKFAVARISRLQSELERASRVATMGELTASLAHELSQPLAAILANAEAAKRLLARENPDLCEVAAALDDVIRDERRADQTIRSVRALFKGEEPQESVFDAAELLRETARLVRCEAAIRDVVLTLEAVPALPPVRGDRVQLQEALINLVLNAFDSVGEDGDGPREVVVSAFQAEPGWVRIAVRDSGKGIAPGAEARIFDAFYTTKRDGMGMGLAIARSIIEAHDGSLRAAQNADRGATFELALPLGRESRSAEQLG